MILETYLESLKNLEDKIPYNYPLKKNLVYKINNVRNTLFHTAPEVISMVFSNSCVKLIDLLPEKENGITKPGDEWADEGWKFITDAAREVNVYLIKKGYN